MRTLVTIGLIVVTWVILPPRLVAPSSPVCASQTEGWVKLSICLEKAVFRLDEPVAMRLTVRNVGHQEGTLAFFPQQLFNVLVYTPEGRKVYDYSETHFFRFTMLPDRSRVLPPGGSFVGELAWGQTADDPSKSPGKYVVEGVLLGRVSGVAQWPIRTPRITIELR